MPIASSSSCVRAASAKADAWARATSTMRVRCGSCSAATASAYTARCFSRPAIGPRHEASPWPTLRKSVQAPGSCSIRSVWPVGAVSKMMWSYLVRNSGWVSRSVNSLKEAISVVQEPESCSVIEAISAAGSSARTGPTIRSR